MWWWRKFLTYYYHNQAQASFEEEKACMCACGGEASKSITQISQSLIFEGKLCVVKKVHLVEQILVVFGRRQIINHHTMFNVETAHFVGGSQFFNFF